MADSVISGVLVDASVPSVIEGFCSSEISTKRSWLFCTCMTSHFALRHVAWRSHVMKMTHVTWSDLTLSLMIRLDLASHLVACLDLNPCTLNDFLYPLVDLSFCRDRTCRDPNSWIQFFWLHFSFPWFSSSKARGSALNLSKAESL